MKETDMTKNEATIQELKKLLVKPNYAEKTPNKNKKIDKNLLLKKAEKISKTLDSNDSLSTSATN